MSGPFLREAGRKVFHFLCLVYLAFYHWQGRGRTLMALAVWTAVVYAVERVRLSQPEVNAFLLKAFGGIHRPEEEREMSAIVWTSSGCWVTIAAFGAAPRLVDGGLLMLAFGDAAAALVGKTLGRRAFTVGGKRKTVEGALACLAACLAVGLWGGYGLGPSAAAAVVATVVEVLAPPPDDNFWLPVAAAFTLAFLA